MKVNEYIKYFDNHEDYLEYKFSSDFVEPNVSHCVAENDVHYNKLIDHSNEYFTFIAIEDGTFKISSNDESSTNYSLDNGETWVELANYTDTPTVSAGQKIMWKAELTTSEGLGGIGYIFATGRFAIEGNIMSLLYGDEFQDKTDLSNYRMPFYGLFGECRDKIISAKNLILPATTLSSSCYFLMFDRCTNLVEAPSILPATTLTRNCYQGMFEGCTSLTNAPELPATTLEDWCYRYMFEGCTSLTTAPELPATNVRQECYQGMFAGCTSLTTAPELPATTFGIACYQGMFQGCTSLTTAPELPATTLSNGCYMNMFQGCSSLNYIKCLATELGDARNTENWVNGVAPSGTFVKAEGMSDWTSGNSGIPVGWTVENA